MMRMVAIVMAMVSGGGPLLGQQQQPRVRIEDEIRRNLLREQLNASTTVADYALPEAFVIGFVDRILQASFRERAYRVAGIGGGRAPAQASVRGAELPYRLLDMFDAPAVEQPEGCPEFRGFRYPFDSKSKFVQPRPNVETPRVAKSLARTGLVATTAGVLHRQRVVAGLDSVEDAEVYLVHAGVPVDLLGCFADDGRVETVLRRLLARIDAGVALDGLIEEAAKWSFSYRASESTFRPTYEDGGDAVAAVRVQLPRGDYWAGRPDGGAMDLAEQLLVASPDTQFVIQVAIEHAGVVDRALRARPELGPSRITVVPHGFAIDQWAQDNGKAGSVVDGDRRIAATLVPRFASRREDASRYVPGENHALADLAAHGHRLVPSSLLFQGGDLLFVRDPLTKRDLLIVGEAEVLRNVALGLRREEAVEALRIEFGADACVVLPTLSFHIDYDVTFRRVGESLVAFVNDVEAGRRAVLESVLQSLGAAGLSEELRDAALEHLRKGRHLAMLHAIGGFLGKQYDRNGAFGAEFLRKIEPENPMRALGTFARLMVALEWTEFLVVKPTDKSRFGWRPALMRSFDRQVAAGAAYRRVLEAAGCKVVGVPGLVAGAQGCSAINGVQTEKAYWMPTYGGALQGLDSAAQRAFESVLGRDVAVVPIRAWESQHRQGAVHCSVAVYPRRLELR